MNTADSEEMARSLLAKGFQSTGRLREADLVLMNTCTVREQAEHRADSNIGRLRVWKAENPNRILIVAGCAASRWGDSIKKKYPFIDLVSPATRIDQFPETVAQVLKERWNWEGETTDTFDALTRGQKGTGISEFGDSNTASPRPRIPASADLFGSETTAYVTIMRGCNLDCSYCIVPQVRGREIYRPMPEILEEIRQKTAQGFREIMLLGQTVNSYYWRDMGYVGIASGRPENGDSADSQHHLEHFTNPGGNQPANPRRPLDFADLLRAVDALPGVEIIRFMSPHPKHMRARVIDAMADCKKVSRHLHLPVQSGSDKLLSSMRRLYTRSEYLAILERLRTAMPGLLITTDIIVGYPGESGTEFEESLSLMREARFDGLFAFKYSPRPGTLAAALPDDVPEAVKEERLQAVLRLNESIKEAVRPRVQAAS